MAVTGGPIWVSSDTKAISGTSVAFDAMNVGQIYRLSANTDIWFTVGASGGSATADADNNHFLVKGAEVLISPADSTNNVVHAIQDLAGGHASLSLLAGIA